jgi:hypothetical protein
MTSNTNYTYTLTVNPPDGLSSVLNAIIGFNGQINGQTQSFTLWVNGQSCNNPTYSIATAFSTTGNMQFYFDCSNIIKQAGNYVITLRSSVNTGTMQGWIDLTYMNNPLSSITLHGTEYINDQTAKVWLQLLNSSQQSILSAVCYTDIYTPAGGIYIERATMTNMLHDGIYYYNLAVPLNEGVYPVIATCYYEATETPNFPSSVAMINGTLDSGTVSNVVVEDGSYLLTTETAVAFGNPRKYESQFMFSNGGICNNISSALLTGITVSWVGRWNSNVANDEITISVYNYTSSRWIPLPNTITGSGTGVKSVSNSLSFNNITTAGLVNTSGKRLMLKFNDTTLSDTSSTGLDYDFLSLNCDQLGSPQWQQVKGSSEIHISRQEGTDPFTVYSLCGDSDLSFCSEFRDDLSINNQSQGYIFENLTFLNTHQSIINSYYDYETPLGVDCTAVLDILLSNGTSILNDVIFSLGNKDNCNVIIPVDFTEDDYQKNVILYLNNYLKWEMERDEDVTTLAQSQIVPFCQQTAVDNGVTYVLPIITDLSPLYENNPLLLSCYRLMDDLYWFFQYYNDSLSVTTSGEYESYLSELKYYYPLITEHARTIIQMSTFDLVNKTPERVWNYTNRTLTQNLSATVTINTTQIANDVWSASNRSLSNNTQIAQDVWNWAGNITDNVLTQIATKIWTWVGRYINGEANQ